MSENQQKAVELVLSLTGALMAISDQADAFGVSAPVISIVCTFDGPVEAAQKRFPVFARQADLAWIGLAHIEDVRSLVREIRPKGVAMVMNPAFPRMSHPVLFLGPGEQVGAFDLHPNVPNSPGGDA